MNRFFLASIALLMSIMVFCNTSGYSNSNSFLVNSSNNVQPPLTATADVTDVSCYSGNDGVINLDVSGGVTPYSYLWSTGSTMQNLTDLSTGLYSVTITDSQTGSSGGSFNWSYINTGISHIIMLPSTGIIVNGQPINTGDYVGVFYERDGSLVCGGYVMWGDEGPGNTAIAAWGDDPITSVKDGFDTGEVFNWKVWSSSVGEEINMTATYQTGGFLSQQGNFTVNGMSGISTLTGNYSSGQTYVVSAYVNQPAALNMILDLANATCSYSNNGWASATVEGGTSPYAYLWSNGSTSALNSGLGMGIYIITATDAHNCSIVGGVYIDQSPALNLSVSKTDVTVYGGSDGTANVSVTGGLSPYSYLWSNGATNGNISGLTAGSYSVTVMDYQQCFAEISVDIMQPLLPPLIVNYTGTDVSCNGSCNGSILLSPEGGISPYYFHWSNGYSFENIYNLCPGIYTVTVTDSQESGGGTFNWSYINTGLTHTILIPTGVVTINDNPISVGDYIGVFYNHNGSLFCGGYHVWDGDISFVSAWGDDPLTPEMDGFSYGDLFVWKTWVMSDGLEVNMTPVYMPGMPNQGTYVTNGLSGLLSLIGSYAPPVHQTVVKNITINEPALEMSISVSVVNVSCSGENNGSIDLTVNGQFSPFTYLWSNGAITEDISGLPPGTYSVTVTDNHNCTASVSCVVTQPDQISIIADINNVTCYGGNNGSIDLTVTGGTSPYYYMWSDNQTTGNIDGLVAGAYTVTVTDYDGSIELTVENGVSPFIFRSGNIITPGTFTNLAAGTYEVTVTDANNCMVIGDYFISQPEPLVAEETATEIQCNGYLSDVTISAAGGTAPYYSTGTYSLPAGGYSYFVSDANGCQAWGNFTLTQPMPLIAQATASPILCNGGWSEITVTATGGTEPYFGTGTFEHQAGYYTFNIWDDNGCQASVSIEVTEPLSLQGEITATPIICNGGWSEVTVTASGGTEPYYGTGTFERQAGYNSFTIRDNNGCQASVSIEINEPQLLQIETSATAILCNGELSEITVTATGGTEPYSGTGIFNVQAGNYMYYVSDANGCQESVMIEITQPQLLQPEVTYPPILCHGGWTDVTVGASGGTSPYFGEGIFHKQVGYSTFTVFDAENCQATVTIYIPEPDALVISYTKGDETIFSLSDGWINLSVSGGTTPYSYLWSNGLVTQDISGLTSGLYNVTVTDANGCTASQSVTIQTLANSATQYIPMSGWCFISTYIYPVNPSVAAVFSSANPHVYLVKNGNGNIYWPVYNINNIGNMVLGQGYQVKMISNFTLAVTGMPANPSITPVNIPAGWSFLGYLRQTPGNMITMLSSIASHIYIVKDENGWVYWPAYGLNAIGNMVPGKGYQIKMNSPATLFYPANTENIEKLIINHDLPVHFTGRDITGSNMTLGIPSTAWPVVPSSGDEIGIFGEHGQLAGCSVIDGDFTEVTIWGNEDNNGLADNESYSIRLWNRADNSESDLKVTEWKEGNEFFTADNISIIEKFSSELKLPLSLGQNSPNPFRNSTEITFCLPEKMNVELSVWNILGEKTGLLLASEEEAGIHKLVFNANEYASGIYILKMTTPVNVQTIQMNIIR
ncbi:MAG: hypothetical protein NTW49_05810 [Bacteroidia bacterium]|nr:hypothetical protein [Bacteroidia bacterium]